MVNLKVKPDLSNSDSLSQNSKDRLDKIRLLLVDDQNSIRQYLRSSLEPELDLEIVGSAADGQTAVSLVETLQPDIVLIDIEMPRMDGLQATQIIKERFVNTKVIVLSNHDNNEYIDRSLKVGAKGYLLKNTPATEIVHAIRYVYKGYLQLGPGLFEKLESNNNAITTYNFLENKNQQHSEKFVVSSQPTNSLTKTKSLQPNNHEWSSSTKELIETLPQVWTRGLLYFLIVFVGIILPWAMFSKVDETGSARGRLEPKGKVFTVDAPVSGTVAEVFVTEGQLVKEKQHILKLESESIESELQQIQTRTEGQQNELAQLKLLKNQLVLTVNTQEQQNKAQQLEKQAQIDQAKQNLQSLKNAFNLQSAEKQSQVDQARQELQHARTALELAEIAELKSKEELQRYVEAEAQGIISEIQVVEAESVRQEKKRLLEQALSDNEQADLRLSEQQSSYEKLIHEANSEIEQAQLRLQEQEESYQSLIHSGKIATLKSQEQLKELETQIGTLISQSEENQSQIDALEYQLAQRIVTAPEEGSIFQLPIQKNGAVVNPGDLIAEIAPQQAPLILKAQMTPPESGSLDVGMPVKLKFDAYPFQDYGIVEGKLVNISPTTKVIDTEEGKTESYELDVELDRNYIQAKNKRVALRPGQTATAEVIVRQRRLIDFVLEPFKKLHKDGLEL